MTARTNYEAAQTYVKRQGKSLDGMDVEIVAFLQVAQALDDTASGALLSEYRKFKALLDAAVSTHAEPSKDEQQEDDLLSPKW